MKETIDQINISQYMPIVIDWATNTLLAIGILFIGIWIANRVYNLVVGISKKVDMHFGIAYDEDTDAARKVIDEVLANHPHILKEPAPFVEVETLNESSVDFLVRPFCEGAHYFDVLYTVPEQVKKALDANSIEIPFPHRKVIVVNENAS